MLAGNPQEALLVNLVKQSVVILAVGVALAACGNERKQPATEPATGSGASKAEARLAEPAQPKQAESAQGLAQFDGDALVACSFATIRFDATLTPTSLSKHGPLMLAQDGLGAARGDAETALGDGSNGKTMLTKIMRVTMFELTAEQLAKGDADAQKQVTDLRRQMAESVPKDEELKESGHVLVDRCEFPNRTALATCAIDDEIKDFGWTLVVHHFDVKSTTDSDSAMKNCLSIGGKWNVASGDAVTLERAKQHSQQRRQRLEKHSKDLNRQLENLKSMANE